LVSEAERFRDDARINDYRRWETEEAIRCMEVVWNYVREVVGSVT